MSLPGTAAKAVGVTGCCWLLHASRPHVTPQVFAAPRTHWHHGAVPSVSRMAGERRAGRAGSRRLAWLKHAAGFQSLHSVSAAPPAFAGATCVVQARRAVIVAAVDNKPGGSVLDAPTVSPGMEKR